MHFWRLVELHQLLMIKLHLLVVWKPLQVVLHGASGVGWPMNHNRAKVKKEWLHEVLRMICMDPPQQHYFTKILSTPLIWESFHMKVSSSDERFPRPQSRSSKRSTLMVAGRICKWITYYLKLWILPEIETVRSPTWSKKYWDEVECSGWGLQSSWRHNSLIFGGVLLCTGGFCSGNQLYLATCI